MPVNHTRSNSHRRKLRRRCQQYRPVDQYTACACQPLREDAYQGCLPIMQPASGREPYAVLTKGRRPKSTNQVVTLGEPCCISLRSHRPMTRSIVKHVVWAQDPRIASAIKRTPGTESKHSLSLCLRRVSEDTVSESLQNYGPGHYHLGTPASGKEVTIRENASRLSFVRRKDVRSSFSVLFYDPTHLDPPRVGKAGA